MRWVEDTYVVLAGDVAAYDCGRAWNCKIKRWETVSGNRMQPSMDTPYRLRAVFLRIFSSTGAGVRGRLGQLYVVGDATATDRLIRLQGGNDLLGGNTYISWQGDFPMCAGFQWRISQGGLIAAEVVLVKVGYDER